MELILRKNDELIKKEFAGRHTEAKLCTSFEKGAGRNCAI